jgi:hypothetical protein
VIKLALFGLSSQSVAPRVEFGGVISVSFAALFDDGGCGSGIVCHKVRNTIRSEIVCQRRFRRIGKSVAAQTMPPPIANP